MHIHKINSTSQEHQNFLAQNRKDPITGDSILEGDEVVFCASCKSVFLSDTWEYLEEQHCEQFDTLTKFPSNSNLSLRNPKDIIFYSLFPPNKNDIPSDLNWNLWIRRSGKLAKEGNNFYDNSISYFFMIFTFLISLLIADVSQSFVPIIISFFIMIVINIIKGLLQDREGEKLKTIHKEFTGNVFYISKTGIGFSSSYGIEEFILSANDITYIKFHFSPMLFGGDYFTIEDTDKVKLKVPISDRIKTRGIRKFLDALNTLYENNTISIQLEAKEGSVFYDRIVSIVKEKEYNISVYKC